MGDSGALRCLPFWPLLGGSNNSSFVHTVINGWLSIESGTQTDDEGWSMAFESCNGPPVGLSPFQIIGSRSFLIWGLPTQLWIWLHFVEVKVPFDFYTKLVEDGHTWWYVALSTTYNQSAVGFVWEEASLDRPTRVMVSCDVRQNQGVIDTKWRRPLSICQRGILRIEIMVLGKKRDE